MRTCGNCHFFDAIDRHPLGVGHCLAEPPLAMPQVVPNPSGAILRNGPPQMMQVMSSQERPTSPKRRACRHWRPIDGQSTDGGAGG